MKPKFPMTDEEAQRFIKETQATIARKPVKSRHDLVTLGSKTERGGEVVTASTGYRSSSKVNPCVSPVSAIPSATRMAVKVPSRQVWASP